VRAPPPPLALPPLCSRADPAYTTFCSTPNNLGTVKKLHACLFPVTYSPSFFDSLLNPLAHPEDYNKLVFYQDLPVGVVVCRLELSDAASPKTLAEAAAASKGNEVDGADKDKAKASAPVVEGKSYKLYIMTLGVLACVPCPPLSSERARAAEGSPS